MAFEVLAAWNHTKKNDPSTRIVLRRKIPDLS